MRKGAMVLCEQQTRGTREIERQKRPQMGGVGIKEKNSSEEVNSGKKKGVNQKDNLTEALS